MWAIERETPFPDVILWVLLRVNKNKKEEKLDSLGTHWKDNVKEWEL